MNDKMHVLGTKTIKDAIMTLANAGWENADIARILRQDEGLVRRTIGSTGWVVQEPDSGSSITT